MTRHILGGRFARRAVDRPRPARPLEARDFRVHFVMATASQRFPYLLDALDDAIDIAIACTATTITISDRRSARTSPATTCYASSTAGTVVRIRALLDQQRMHRSSTMKIKTKVRGGRPNGGCSGGGDI